MDPVVGARLAADVTFRIAGVATDPDAVLARVKAPNGVLTTVSYPTADLVREAVGAYRFEFNADVAGTWWVRFEATGTVEATEERSIVVRPSSVT